MSFLTGISQKFSQELNQNENLQKDLILQILKSKRLLIEHVESLQHLDLLYNTNDGSFEGFTFLKSTGIVGVAAVTFIHIKSSYKYMIPALVGIVPALYLTKCYNIRKARNHGTTLEKLLRSLDQTDRTIRKLEMFLNELQLLKNSASFLNDKDNKFIRDCFNSVFSVIKSVFVCVKFLEDHQLDDTLESSYSRFTDSNEMEIMDRLENWSGDFKDIKDYHLLFQLIQSQLLARFALLVASNVNESIDILNTQINDLSTKLLDGKDAITKSLKMIMDPIGKLRASPLIKLELLPKEYQRIKFHSLNLSSKVLALALDSQLLDETITKFVENPVADKFEEVQKMQSALEVITMKLNECQEESSDLFKITQQILNQQEDVEKLNEEDLENVENPDRESTNIVANDVVDLPQPTHDILVDVGAQDDEKALFYLEVDPLSKEGRKQTEARYKVIVKDLMGNEKFGKMRQKFDNLEKEILKAKGIEFTPDFNNCEVTNEESGSDDSEDEFLSKKKVKKNEKKYDEVRDFLMSKGQVNLFGGPGGFPLPAVNFVSEDILE